MVFFFQEMPFIYIFEKKKLGNIVFYLKSVFKSQLQQVYCNIVFKQINLELKIFERTECISDIYFCKHEYYI